MNPFIQALMRHVLTGVGMWITSKGYADAAVVEQGIGAAITLLGIGLSMLDKKKLLA